ncbi:MAG: HNH endonuclease [Bacteroidaceae bacterium]|nr:HNH endonuclease [Bacteroidaceae bacterium]
MKIDGTNFNFIDTFNAPIFVPDCFVMGGSKLGAGHGEAKLYIGSKEVMYPFFGNKGFVAHCFLLKSDLISYMNALHAEYLHPSQQYRAADEMPKLWHERMKTIEDLPEVIEFNVYAQDQIEGPRGYVNSKDFGYQLIREISLPLVSYISVMQLSDPKGLTVYYWKLFADFEAISDKREATVFTYGKKGDKPMPRPQFKETLHEKEIRQARQGQGSYREKLLEECPFCPITMINDERLLIASHIKPWAVASDAEKLDPKNGFVLSPLYDKLFDRGFMTFTEDRKIMLSNWISPMNKKRLGVEDGQFIQLLPLDDARQKFMKFHRSSVFKG